MKYNLRTYCNHIEAGSVPGECDLSHLRARENWSVVLCLCLVWLGFLEHEVCRYVWRVVRVADVIVGVREMEVGRHIQKSGRAYESELVIYSSFVLEKSRCWKRACTCLSVCEHESGEYTRSLMERQNGVCPVLYCLNLLNELSVILSLHLSSGPKVVKVSQWRGYFKDIPIKHYQKKTKHQQHLSLLPLVTSQPNITFQLNEWFMLSMLKLLCSSTFLK